MANSIVNNDIVSVDPSKLIGYPADPNLVLFGDGSWGLPSAGTIADNSIAVVKLLT